MFKWLYSSIRIKTKEYQRAINFNNGVPQGFISSPLLFNVYINDLISELSSHRNISVFVYADDLAIVANSKHDLIKAN